MPLFKRRPNPERSFSVGVDGHVVVVGGAQAGCGLFEDIDGYIGAIAERVSTRPDGRDTIAMLNAKMDYAEMVDAAVLVLTLAMEELLERGVLQTDDAPPPPRRAPVARDLATYDYIQSLYAASRQRIEWARTIDALFRERDIALLQPAGDASRR
jgi:hypothetical protein